MSKVADCTPREFLERLNVITDDGPQRFGDVMAPFQREICEAIENALRRIVGLPVDPALQQLARHYWELPRGSAKTTLQAAIALYPVYSSPNYISGLFVAADQDQGRLSIEAARQFVRQNAELSIVVRDPVDRKLKPFIEVTQDKIRNVVTGSCVQVISSDAGSAYGRLDDLIIIDELTNWKQNARPLFDAIYSGAGKRRHATVIIAANAPFMGGSWQWPLREDFRTDPLCHFVRLDGPSPWMAPAALADMQRKLPPMTFNRLFLNIPVESAGDLLTADVINAAFAANVPLMLRAERDYAFTAGVDLSVARDWSSFVVLARHKSGRFRVARTWNWKPAPGQKISQEHIKAVILESHRAYKFRRVVCDPWQAEGMAEALSKAGVPIFTRNQTGAALNEQCFAIVEVMNAGCIDIPADESLRQQFLTAQIEQKSYGVRFVSPRTSSTGHSDTLSALSMVLSESRDVLPLGGSGSWGGHIAPTTRGLSTTRTDAAYQGWKFEQHLNALRAAGVEVLGSPYRTVTPNSEGQQ